MRREFVTARKEKDTDEGRKAEQKNKKNRQVSTRSTRTTRIFGTARQDIPSAPVSRESGSEF